MSGLPIPLGDVIRIYTFLTDASLTAEGIASTVRVIKKICVFQSATGFDFQLKIFECLVKYRKLTDKSIITDILD